MPSVRHEASCRRFPAFSLESSVCRKESLAAVSARLTAVCKAELSVGFLQILHKNMMETKHLRTGNGCGRSGSRPEARAWVKLTPFPNIAAAHHPLAHRTPQINAQDIKELKL